MKNLKILAVAGLMAAASVAPAQPVVTGSLFAGLVWTIGGGAGLSVKYVTSNELETPVLAGGVSYYFDGSWGADLGLAYNSCSLTATVGYDFLKNGFQFGVGTLDVPPFCGVVKGPPQGAPSQPD